MKKFYFFLAMLLCGASVFGQTTYTWNQTGSASWATSTNWTPTRTTPATNDVLVFDNGATITVTAVPTQTIGQMSVGSNTTVNLQGAGVGTTLTVGGGTGTDLSVASGSSLNINVATNTTTIALATGTTGSISGNMSFTSAAHKLTAVDPSAVTFQSGSVFTAGTGFSSNSFGTTSLNSIIFANGSTYIQGAGANPFGAGAPNSVVVFQTGSLYKMTANLAPSFSGRIYANCEINSSTFSQSPTGTGALTMDNLTITDGTLNLNLTAGGVNIKGTISVATGEVLTFSPAAANTLNLNGTSPQFINNSGTLTFAANAAVVIANSTGVTFNNNQTVSGTMTVNAGAKLATSAVLTLTGSPAINGSFHLNEGGSETGGTMTYGPSSTLVYAGITTQTPTVAEFPSANGPANLTVNNNVGITFPASFTRTVPGTLGLDQGTLSVGANALTLGGNITRSFGNIDASNGSASVILSRSTSFTLPTNCFTGEINNLTKENSNTIFIGSALTVRTVVLSGGDLTLGGNTLTITTGITKTSGAIDASNSLSTVVFTNTAPIVLPTGTFEAGNVYGLTVNGPGGIALSSAMTVNTLTLTNGKIELGANDMQVSTINDGSSTSYIKTNGIGTVRLNNITTEAQVPVGRAKFNPVTIENGGGHNWAVSVEDGVVTDPGFPSDKAVLVTWNITPSVNPPAGAANITFQFDETSQVGVNFVEATAQEGWYRTTFWHPTGTASGVTGISGEKKIKVSGLTHFSPYAVSNLNGPLPIAIDYFNGVKQGSNHLLNWKVNCYNTPSVTMSLERSTDGRNYSEIYSINATALQCQQPFNYTNPQPAPGINYYRLKMADANGKVSYSGIIALLNKQNGFDIIGVKPNPVNASGIAVLNVTAAQAGELQIVVTDMNGKKVMTQTETLVAGSKQVQMNLAKLSTGTYLVTGYYSDGTSQTVRVLKQ